MKRENIIEMFTRLREFNPKPTTELHYTTPFELLIAVILSAQATDVGVNKASRRLYPIANTPQAILDLGEEELKRHISTIGLFNAKAKNVIATCGILVDQHDGEVPRERAALEDGRIEQSNFTDYPSLKLADMPKVETVIVPSGGVWGGVGEPTIAVDTHIFRVANRTGLAKGKNVREVEDKLMRVVPAEFRQDAHHWLILHGRYVCKARKPDCPACLIRDLCSYRYKTME